MLQVLRIILAIILPPLGVFLTVGLKFHFWLNLLLTIVFLFLPGVVHALWVVITKGEE